jgi:hypothetical protein
MSRRQKKTKNGSKLKRRLGSTAETSLFMLVLVQEKGDPGALSPRVNQLQAHLHPQQAHLQVPQQAAPQSVNVPQTSVATEAVNP